MTIYEFAIAREANRLLLASETRELTDGERDLLYILLPTLSRLHREESVGRPL